MLNDYGDILTLNELCEVLKISENVAYRLLEKNPYLLLKLAEFTRFPKKLWNLIFWWQQI